MRVSILAVVSLAIGAVSVDAAETSVDERSGKWQISCFDDETGRYRDCYVGRDALAVRRFCREGRTADVRKRPGGRIP